MTRSVGALPSWSLYLRAKGNSYRGDFTLIGAEAPDSALLKVTKHVHGPAGPLPLSAEILLAQPSGNLLGPTMSARSFRNGR
ncbi:MAG: hypothetical protein ABR907_17355, partial [Terracidiphilus sp.]